MALLSFREVFTAFDQLFCKAPTLENLQNQGENEKCVSVIPNLNQTRLNTDKRL